MSVPRPTLTGMNTGTPQPPSKSALRKAGSIMRKYLRNEATLEEFQGAIRTMQAHRSRFNRPMVDLNTELRSLASDLSIEASVTQRLKREATILEKLCIREPGLDFSRMQDIGGLRVVVDSLANLIRYDSALCDRWSDRIVDRRDYISCPRDSGYRAIHVVVSESGLHLEVQLRSRRMHAWAQMVEGFSGQLGENFKQDSGDHVIQRFARVLSELYAHEDEGTTPPAHLSAEFESLWIQVDAVLGTAEEEE